MTQPASYEEILRAKRDSVPAFVFAAFNKLLAEKLPASGSAIIKRGEAEQAVYEELLLAIPLMTTQERARLSLDEAAVTPTSDDVRFICREAFSRGWFDVESSYRRVGWRVEYDKPGYNESYEGFWKFSKGD